VQLHQSVHQNEKLFQVLLHDILYCVKQLLRPASCCCPQ
jgi:hypothetical protein